MVSLYLCSYRSNARGAQKALQGSEMETRELLGGTEEKSDEGYSMLLNCNRAVTIRIVLDMPPVLIH